MRRLIKLFQVLFSLALLGSCGWFIYYVLARFAHFVTSQQSQVAAAIIAGSATITVALITVAIGKTVENRAAVLREIRAKKVPAYEELLDVLFRFLYENKTATDRMSDEEKVELFSRVTQRAIIWASDEVVSVYGRFRTDLVDQAQKGTGSSTALFLFEDLVFAIRRDLGHKNRGIKRGDLLRFFINDIDVHL